MNSRERVYRALNVDSPDRVPRDIVVFQSTLNKRSAEVKDFLNRYPMDIDLPNFSYGSGLESGTRAEVGIY
jgi:hypothetical protein